MEGLEPRRMENGVVVDRANEDGSGRQQFGEGRDIHRRGTGNHHRRDVAAAGGGAVMLAAGIGMSWEGRGVLVMSGRGLRFGRVSRAARVFMPVVVLPAGCPARDGRVGRHREDAERQEDDGEGSEHDVRKTFQVYICAPDR